MAITAIVARKQRFSVVEDFCGHGLGRLFHDEPNVVHAWPNFKNEAQAEQAYLCQPRAGARHVLYN